MTQPTASKHWRKSFPWRQEFRSTGLGLGINFCKSIKEVGMWTGIRNSKGDGAISYKKHQMDWKTKMTREWADDSYDGQIRCDTLLWNVLLSLQTSWWWLMKSRPIVVHRGAPQNRVLPSCEGCRQANWVQCNATSNLAKTTSNPLPSSWMRGKAGAHI